MTLLYHYCTVEAFHAIVSTRNVRLSSVRQSNDETEGSLVRPAVERLLARRSGLNDELVNRLQTYVMELEEQFDGMALCLSEEGDQLSQWRGYADDGRGVAIGFRQSVLQALSEKSDESDDKFDIQLYKALYKEADHDAAVEGLIELLCEFDLEQARHIVDDPKVQELSRRLVALHRLRLSLTTYDAVYSLKHPAFSEEREWRLLHHFDWDHARPDGYHPGKARLVPFVNFALLKDVPEVISEVVLGPRHATPKAVVERFLLEHGNTTASESVRCSLSPYRRDA